MGRYWNTQNFDGKFTLAVQPSDDPELFGMDADYDEDDEGYISYDLNKNDVLHKGEHALKAEEYCLKELVNQYNILKVPEEDRKFVVKDQNELFEVWEQNYDFAMKEDPDGIHYASSMKKRMSEAFPGSLLALSRIYLGVAIYSELVNLGHCHLEAEV